MKILGFNASPRLEGNCRLSVNKVLEYAKTLGYETELIDLNLLDIKPCLSCNFCKAHAGLCMLDDDMQDIRRKIREADALILAAPIYFSQLNAQATLFINRLYAFYQTEMLQAKGESYIVTIKNIYDYDILDSDVLKNIKAGVIITQGLENEEEYSKYIESGIFDQLNFLFNLKDILVLTDTNEPGIVGKRDEQLAKIDNFAKTVLE
ncbi:MAG: flavodoxin family protein [Methanosphaera stadtmanae]|nr:flavodoxin family protein [Methanosphaera stadtmanae]